MKSSWHMLLVVTGMFTVSDLKGQDRTIDSLQKLLSGTNSEEVRSVCYAELGANFSGYDTTKAISYLRQARAINDRLNSKYLWGYYYRCLSTYVYDRGLFDSCLKLTDTALSFFNQAAGTVDEQLILFQRAETFNTQGLIYTAISHFEDAMKKLQEALELYERTNHPLKMLRLGSIYTNLANVFFLTDEYPKALSYELLSLPYYEKANDPEMLALAYTFLGADYMRLDKLDSAKKYLDAALPYVKQINKNNISVEFYGKLAEYYWRHKDWETTRKYFIIAYENARAINQVYNEIEYLRGIGNCYYAEKKHREAARYFQMAEELTEKSHLQGTQRDLYWTISRNYHQMGEYKKASDYMLYFTKLSDSIAGVKLKQTIAEMDEKYQSEKKQRAIEALQKEKQIQQLSIRQKATLNYFLFGSIAALLIIGLLTFRNFRHKQLLSKQTEQLHARRIRELEQEKQLISMNSLLKGQEEERGRLAKDLHDGLGGMLSGVKLSLGAMKGNLILSEENARLFSKALGQLDNTIAEMRRVAHNMMPEALVKLGLQQAVQDYCDSLSESQDIIFNCQFYGLDNRLDAATEIVVYRILQELVNNVIKHAEASQILVQVMRHDQNLAITVEDNGKGFEVNQTNFVKGAGLSNVKTRVDYLKGNLDIQSTPGKGTSIHIDCIIES